MPSGLGGAPMLDELPALAHVDAESLDDAVRWLVEYGDRAKILAGGTDLLGLLKDRIDGPGMPLPDVLVNVKSIPGMADIAEKPDGGLRIGAAATLVDIERHPAVTARFAALGQASAAIASRCGLNENCPLPLPYTLLWIRMEMRRGQV
jgi:xanthine dehydrogenase YagS FAD-binding subunit